MSIDRQIEELEHEFVNLVRKSPKTKAEVQKMEVLRDSLELALRLEAKPLTDELAGVGIYADLWDLVNTSASYPAAIPVLVKHLRRRYHRRNKEGIVRALAVKEAKGIANKAVMAEYGRAPKEDHHFRWAFGNTMSVIVTNDDLNDLMEIVLDPSNGDSRWPFVEALAKIRSPAVIETLRKLLDDPSPSVQETARKALRRKRLLDG